MKIIIVGSTQTQQKLDIAHHLINLDDSLSIGYTFTTDIDYKDKLTEDFIYYLSNDDVIIGYKNNAFMYATTTNDITKGITLTDMYSDDIFVLDYADFNNISEKILNEINGNCLFVIIDEKAKHIRQEIIESNYTFGKIEQFEHYLYFLNEPLESIVTTILWYINPNRTDNERRLCKEENS